jgi:hypothetical protein
MAGFYIYTGALVSETDLRTKLSNYSQNKSVAFEGSTILKDNVDSFQIKPDGSIFFNYYWDERIPYTFRGETKYRDQTFYLNIRIIRMNGRLFYLIQKFGTPSYMVSKLSEIIYGEPKKIAPITITSDAIKQIENEDFRVIVGEFFTNISDRDHAMGLYGTLRTKEENGSTSSSEAHETFENNPKYYTSFTSLSTGFMVYISGKKASLTLKGTEDYNAVESYIKNFILTKIN